MKKSTLTPSEMLLLATEEEYIDQRAKDGFSYSHLDACGREEGIGSIIRSAIEEMPRIPVYAGTLMNALESSEATAATLSRIISQDPFMSAQILKNVNSAYYGFEKKIVDLQHAITLLGINQIHLLVLYHGIRKTLPNTRSFVNLQSQSVILSYLAAGIAEMIDPRTVPVFTTLGLLSNIGRGVIYLAQHRHPEIEQVAPLLNHFAIGSMLLIHWDLPEIIFETTRLMGKAGYDSPQGLPAAYRRSVSILVLAHAVFHLKREGRAEGWDHIGEYMSRAGFGSETVHALAENRILPLLRERKSVLPHVVRNFLETGPQKVKFRESGIGSIEKQVLERKKVQASERVQENAPAVPSEPMRREWKFFKWLRKIRSG
ncbi:MAG: HDOD domain-containing protein [Desulfovibrionales bacterium]